MEKKTFVLIDGYAMMFRAYYAMKKFAPHYDGREVGAVFGCASTLLQVIEKFTPDSIVAAFDAPEKTFRHEMDENYKAQREAAPDDFIQQTPLVHKLVESFGIELLIRPGFEADDIIGTLAQRASSQDFKSYILSGDLDFLQLVSEDILLARFNGKAPDIFGREKTFEKMGVWPEQVIDYKAICGDSSDNYKGVVGVGPKTATNLLTKYKTLEGVYENVADLKPNLAEKFVRDREQAFFCQKLATIHTNVRVDFDFETPYTWDLEKISSFLEEVGFQNLKTRAEKLNKKIFQKDISEQEINSKKELDNNQTSLF